MGSKGGRERIVFFMAGIDFVKVDRICFYKRPRWRRWPFIVWGAPPES